MSNVVQFRPKRLTRQELERRFVFDMLERRRRWREEEYELQNSLFRTWLWGAIVTVVFTVVFYGFILINLP